ncbi:hypothetical protein EJ05DRAFT_243855 [Pseudovirgaria hyperparasitica]|uniref:Uncharacterized protein n=1 Tax=Pseudovirgaria hyperparasitica TaxID=470096 RepID=A0A6A6WGT1_9PEZI|nr:uncharacterized protein EJ05DRAFT_243855 [Pseudovirgaria hyperparasitica]KAF2760847.1 hypothetical protein EJ05DRAFT_243855 [Pseudovirgaria hyperparasitica]
MDPYVPILSESDWDELRDTVIDIDVRDFQGMLLVCIGRLVDGTISAGSKVFANISEDNQERCSYLITRGYLVYEDAFTGILEPFIISRVRKSGGKLPFRTIGINDVVDPIIPCKFLAADIYHAGPNMRALGYRMLEYYRLCGSVRPDVVEMMAKIYETRALTKPPQSPKRHGAKYNVQPQKRISQEPSRQPEMTAREVVSITRSRSGDH